MWWGWWAIVAMAILVGTVHAAAASQADVRLSPGQTVLIQCPTSLQLLAVLEDQTGVLVGCQGLLTPSIPRRDGVNG